MSSVFCFKGVNASSIDQRQREREAKNNLMPDTPMSVSHCDIKRDRGFCENEFGGIYLDKRFFLMCKSCNWCASCLMDDQEYFLNCPECLKDRMEWVPISESECYRLDFDQKLGTVLHFTNNAEEGRHS